MWVVAQEEKGVVQECWVKTCKVYWPSGPNAANAHKSKQKPGPDWTSFDLFKTKFRLGNFTN
ncbi:hypothetical protein DPMN_032589 [Dreissena polymorpha]|uniref:Uncharacterized protein n=1 Tax=Dreissena polymorpha TaxID=45954 RepID=A0A9D4M501_DREPO|nr:hypothetical protein DPMN_032589 [Dreissena polymorpha]